VAREHTHGVQVPERHDLQPDLTPACEVTENTPKSAPSRCDRMVLLSARRPVNLRRIVTVGTGSPLRDYLAIPEV